MQRKIDYTSKDYDGLLLSMSENIKDLLPEWSSRSPSDPGMVLLELFAYVGDVLSYYGDRIANEAFLSTASQPDSVFDIAAMLDYQPSSRTTATVDLTFTVDATADPFVIPAGTRVSTSSVEAAAQGQDPIEFRTAEDVEVDPGVATQYVVEGIEGVRYESQELGVSDGSPRQVFMLPDRGVEQRSVVVRVDAGSGAKPWLPMNYLLDATPLQEAFTTNVLPNEELVVRFGDDVSGRIPPLGAVITADYTVSQGLEGNVALETVTEVLDPDPRIISVTNGEAALGGADIESIESIKTNLPRSLRSVDRAVTEEDFSNLALRSGFVGKANADADIFTHVNVFVSPRGARGIVSDADKEGLLQYMSTRTLVGTTVTILDPRYVGVDIELALQAWPEARHSEIRADVQQTLERFFAYSSVEFGQSITMGSLVAEVQAVDGVRFADIDILSRAGLYEKMNLDLEVDELPELNSVSMIITGGVK